MLLKKQQPGNKGNKIEPLLRKEARAGTLVYTLALWVGRSSRIGDMQEHHQSHY